MVLACKALDEIRASGLDPEAETIFVDVDASAKFRHWRRDELPTLTRARSKSGGFYVTNYQRRTDTEEMLRFQGIRLESLGGHEQQLRTAS